jgi:hypothetical protein
MAESVPDLGFRASMHSLLADPYASRARAQINIYKQHPIDNSFPPCGKPRSSREGEKRTKSSAISNRNSTWLLRHFSPTILFIHESLLCTHTLK